jgi:hypothetical protein
MRAGPFDRRAPVILLDVGVVFVDGIVGGGVRELAR